ncbi:MAG: M55 family metallopeptidase [Clostridiaceae bacterium]
MGTEKKIYIMTDLEGISGIDSMDMIQRDDPRYQYCRERLMADTNAAVDGAFQGGAGQVFVCDGHGGGGNFIKEKLDPRAEITSGGMRQQMDKNLDAVMFIGAHAMAGTLNGFLDHTQDSRKWFNYYINGKKTGELGQWGIMAAQYNLPVIMVSGDQAACFEAGQFFGHISCAIVKYGIGRNGAELLPNEEAVALIRNAAAKAIGLIGQIRPYRPLLPLDIKLELYRSDFCDEIAAKPGVERLDARTVRKVSTNYIDILF